MTDLQERRIGFKSLQESIDTTTSGGKLVFHIFGALAEFEREIIRERTKAGLTAARARGRNGGRYSPEAVLGFYTGLRYHPEDLQRAFFWTRFARVLDPLGYARLMNWRVYAEEALAKRDVALWLGGDILSVEYAGETLSRYEVEYRPHGEGLRDVRRPELFETAHQRSWPQLRLFRLEDALGEGWLKALRLEAYALRGRQRTQETPQPTLFPHLEAL